MKPNSEEMKLIDERLKLYKQNPTSVKSWEQFRFEFLKNLDSEKLVKKLKKK